MKKEISSTESRAEGKKEDKKPYDAPKLVKHGSVEKLTRTTGGAAPVDYFGGPLDSGI